MPPKKDKSRVFFWRSSTAFRRTIRKLEHLKHIDEYTESTRYLGWSLHFTCCSVGTEEKQERDFFGKNARCAQKVFPDTPQTLIIFSYLFVLALLPDVMAISIALPFVSDKFLGVKGGKIFIISNSKLVLLPCFIFSANPDPLICVAFVYWKKLNECSLNWVFSQNWSFCLLLRFIGWFRSLSAFYQTLVTSRQTFLPMNR